MTVDQLTKEFMSSLSNEDKRKLAYMTIEYQAGRISMDELRDAYIEAPGGQEWYFKVLDEHFNELGQRMGTA